MKKQTLILVVSFLFAATSVFAAGDLIVDGKLGVGTTTPNEQIEITGNLRLPTTTSTTGILKLGTDRFIHAYGTDNVFVGIGAGNFTMGGTENTAVGNEALSSNAGGFYNAALGYHALYANTGGDYNVAVGAWALTTSTEAGFNTAVGFRALEKNTSGLFNVAIGTEALEDNTTGTSNIGIGLSALISNTTGNDNIAIGHAALDNVTNAERCIAIGTTAMRNNTGGGNIGIGYDALLSNTSGAGNTAVGYAALMFNVGSNNTAIGSETLIQLDSGDQNAVIGTKAMEWTDIGYSNAVIGYKADHYNQNGSSNTIIGCQAGMNTGYNNKSGNVLIGYQAGYYETGSNKLYIDNSNTTSPLIWGDFSADKININGKLGVGNTNPAGLFQVGVATMTVLSSGNVGIGLTNPAHKLEIVAGTTAAGGIGFGTDTELYRSAANTLALASGDSMNLVSGNLNVAGTTVVTSGRIVRTANGTVSAPAFSFSADTNTGIYTVGADTLCFTTGGTERVRIGTSGQVGVGTTSPDATIEIGGSAAAISLNEDSATPANPASGTECRIYMKADKLIIQYNDGGTVRYKYITLSGAGATWTDTTTAP